MDFANNIELKNTMFWLAFSEMIIFTILVAGLLWLVRNSSNSSTLKFGTVLIFSSIIVFVDGMVISFTIDSQIRDMYFLALLTCTLSVLIFIVTVLVNLLVGIIQVVHLLMMDEPSSFHERKNFENISENTFILIFCLFTSALVAIINLVGALTIIPLLFPDNEFNYRRIIENIK